MSLADGPESPDLTQVRPHPQVPHLRVGDAWVSHEHGDQYARARGTPVVHTACGQVIRAALTTRSPLAVGCFDCEAANLH